MRKEMISWVESVGDMLEGLHTGMPKKLVSIMDTKVIEVADNFYTLAEVLSLSEAQIEQFAEELSVALLYKSVADAWHSGRGLVFHRDADMWMYASTKGDLLGCIALDAVPQRWRRQLGMLQLVDGDNVCLKDCGYKHTSNTFFLMESKNENKRSD